MKEKDYIYRVIECNFHCSKFKMKYTLSILRMYRKHKYILGKTKIVVMVERFKHRIFPPWIGHSTDIVALENIIKVNWPNIYDYINCLIKVLLLWTNSITQLHRVESAITVVSELPIPVQSVCLCARTHTHTLCEMRRAWELFHFAQI